MYSPRSRMRFWEQEGQRWNTLQLKGRKYSALHLGFVHRILATLFGSRRRPRSVPRPYGCARGGTCRGAWRTRSRSDDELGEVRAEQPLQGACIPLTVGSRRGGIQREGERVGHKDIHAPEARVASPWGSGRDAALRSGRGLLIGCSIPRALPI
jgi:hypothetical protein